MRTLNIYACGGTGANIASRLAEYHGQSNDGIAKINVCFIDTSRSNLPPGLPEDQIYLFKDDSGKLLDGNGKVRNSNYEHISQSTAMQEILQKFRPADMNLLLHSTGGGTGSVAGPLLAHDLTKMGAQFAVLGVGSTSSKRDLKNTADTLKTYENMADRLGKPICMMYRENSAERSREQIDKMFEGYIFLIATLFSGLNKGLDSADLRNFLDYSKVTDYPARLTALDLFSGSIKLPEDAKAIGSVSLTIDNVDLELGVLVDFHVSGLLNPGASEMIRKMAPIHAITYSGHFGPIIQRLNTLLAAHDDKSKTMAHRQISGKDDKANDKGIVF